MQTRRGFLATTTTLLPHPPRGRRVRLDARDAEPQLRRGLDDVTRCRYVDDRTPGIRRVRAGRGFRYLDPHGAGVRDRSTLARIRSLAVRAVDADLARPGLDRRKVLATVVRLLEITLIRVGNEEYARANGSYGLTTMRTRHVDIDGSTIRFRFRGKSGVRREVAVSDRRLARILERCGDLPGEEPSTTSTKKGYVHPAVFEAHDAGELARAMGKDVHVGEDALLDSLGSQERRVRLLLEQRQHPARASAARPAQ